MNAIDTNVLLYSVDRSEPAKQLIAQQLLHQLRSATEPTFLLWQVLGRVGAATAPLVRSAQTDTGRVLATHPGVSTSVSLDTAHRRGVRLCTKPGRAVQ